MNILEPPDRSSQNVIVLSVTVYLKFKLIEKLSLRQFQNSHHDLVDRMLAYIVKFSYNKDLLPLFCIFCLIRKLLFTDDIIYDSAVLKLYPLLCF